MDFMMNRSALIFSRLNRTNQGVIYRTSGALDVAVIGNGFFILNNNGFREYTRFGQFETDSSGYLTDNCGRKVVGFLSDNTGRATGAMGDIQLPNNYLAVNIDQGGLISVRLPHQVSPVTIGSIALADFVYKTGLRQDPIETTIFTETVSSGVAKVSEPSTSSFGRLYQGYLENVSYFGYGVYEPEVRNVNANPSIGITYRGQ